MDRYIGKLLDNRYEIQEKIGSGGMAVVYKALCHRLNRPVAIKILKDELSQDQDFRRRFHAESQAVAMLSHPNIVSVYDVSHTEGVDYIVMELIDGITLKQYMEQKQVMNWRETLHFATQICKALEHAHGRGIIHRDIKPHNIMILKDGSVKVADFGIARVLSTQNTQTREAIGSVHYISPEQARGSRMDSRTDLYSLGVVMYEMLTGMLPFDGDSPVSVALQHISAVPASPRDRNPSIPQGLEQITMRAMEPDLNKRYPSASQMLQDMESFRLNPAIVFTENGTVTPRAKKEEVKHPASGGTGGKAVKRQRKKRRYPAVIVATLCIGLAVAGLIYLFVFLTQDIRQQKDDILVPYLTNSTYEDAVKRYGEKFDIQIIEHVDSEEAEGSILRQEPNPNMKVKEGATIKVWVSGGLPDMIMPNLVKQQKDRANLALKDFDITIRYVDEFDDTMDPGYVIRTQPAADTVLTPGQEVVLYISSNGSSSGEYTVPIPYVVGKSLTEAKEILDALGMKADVRYVESDEETDKILEQYPPAGEYTSVNNPLQLTVVLGPKIPVIRSQSSDITVNQYELAAIQVVATVENGGSLTYEWFVSYTDSTADMKSIGTGTQSMPLNTEEPGVSHYCCKVTNTQYGRSVSVYTEMITVTVNPVGEQKTKTIHLTLPPEGEVSAVIVVKMDGSDHIPPFTVERARGTIEIGITASGTHVIDIYVDGVLALSRTMDFDE